MVEGRLNLQAGHLAARILGRNSVSKLLCKCIRVAMLECLPSFLHPCPVLLDLIRCFVLCQAVVFGVIFLLLIIVVLFLAVEMPRCNVLKMPCEIDEKGKVAYARHLALSDISRACH